MRYFLFSIFASCLLLANVAEAMSTRVMTPEYLAKKLKHNGEFTSHIGHFGHIEYGNQFVGLLHYPSKNQNACENFTQEALFESYIQDDRVDTFPILICFNLLCASAFYLRFITFFLQSHTGFMAFWLHSHCMTKPIT